MSPKVSVIVPVYNAAAYLPHCLDTLTCQTLKELEIILVLDCPTDGSEKIAEDYAARFPQIRLLYNEKNLHAGESRNRGLDVATGEYIGFVDADDCPYPSLVEKLYNKITSDHDLMAVGCHLEYMDSAGKKIRGGIFLGETTKGEFYEKASKEKLIFMQPTAIYDREVALRVGGHNIDGFPEGKPRYQDLCEDLDLWTRMSDLYMEGKAIVVVPEVLCRYRKHESAMSVNSMGMLLRMRHIKMNLKRRRRGEAELSFIEFRNQLSPK